MDLQLLETPLTLGGTILVMINSFFQPSFNQNKTTNQHIFGARQSLQILSWFLLGAL